MAGHVRRFNPSHQWVHKRIKKGELKIQQMDVQTYFFRRTNINAAGKPRSWTDHLLWHHAAHTIDLFHYQTGRSHVGMLRGAGADPSDARHRHGHGHRARKCRRARSSRCRCRSTTTGRSARSSATSATTAPIRPTTTISSDGKKNPIDLSKVDVSMDGIELEDREFIAAIQEKREPNGSLRRCCPACACWARSRE